MIRSTTSTAAATLLASLLLLSGTATAQRSPGCGTEQTAATGKTTQFNITSSDVQRVYYVALPADYDPDTEYKTIFGFHGAGGIGVFVEADTRLGNRVWGGDKIMVYPDGLNEVWATGFNQTTPVEQDMQFIHDLLEHVRGEYCIDNNRLYATGISNGGGIINRIACNETLGLNFAAYAPVAGAYSGFFADDRAACTPSRQPIPIISFHGGNDTVVPYAGRGGGGLLPTPPIPVYLENWVELNNCTNLRNQTQNYNNGTVVTHLTWDCAGVPNSMEHWYESSMGHVWPSRTPNFSQAMAGTGPTVVEGNEELIRFFDEFPLNRTTDEDPLEPSPTESTGPGDTETSPPGVTETDAPNAAGRVVIERGDGWMVGLVMAAAAVVGGMLV